MKRRYREILNSILNSEDFISGKELAELSNVSLRSIRKDISDINVLLSLYQIRIESQIRRGYHLIESDKQKLKDSDLIRKVLDYEYIVEIPSTPFDRQMYLLLRLTVQDNISIEEASSLLYVSQSTIIKDIDSIRKWLNKNLDYHVSCSLKEGIKLIADERGKRNLISWIFAQKINISVISKYSHYLYGDIRVIDRFRAIYSIVTFECNRYGVYLTGHSAQLFVLEIIIAFLRSYAGLISDPNNEEVSLNPFIISLRENIENSESIHLQLHDWVDIQTLFISKQFLFRTNPIYIVDGQSETIVDEFIKTVDERFSINLRSNPRNRERLCLYVGPMINRLKHHFPIPNKISESIKQYIQKSFILTQPLKEIVWNQLGLIINDIELVYIAIHLELMSKEWTAKLRTILVCDHDESIISYLRDRISHFFDEEITFVDHLSYLGFGDFMKLKTKNIDFIITTSNIADITEIPFVQISPIMDKYDVASIQTYLNHRKP